MRFQQVIGQEKRKHALRGMVESNRMSHALLFLGPEGCGKLALAYAFAQYVLCTDKQDDDSCGKCSNCIKAAKWIHPDIHYSYPTIGSKAVSTNWLTEWRKAMANNVYLNSNDWLQFIGAENKQGNITKDECVEIIKKLSLKIFEGSHKIIIMWLPEYLGKEGNRLLKMIEEPPENTLFILVAENQELILNTILSRCQIVKINRLSDEDLQSALIERQNISQDQAAPIAHLAEGNYNEALSLLENTENNNAKLFLEWMRLCYVGNGVSTMDWVERFSKIGRENQKHFLKYGLHFMREYMLLKLTGDNKVRLLPEELKTAQNLTKVIEWDQIEAITKLFNDCAYYVERNANPRILFLDASLQLNQILKTKATA
jgi:DNA polymerase-3 subunit delta'